MRSLVTLMNKGKYNKLKNTKIFEHLSSFYSKRKNIYLENGDLYNARKAYEYFQSTFPKAKKELIIFRIIFGLDEKNITLDEIDKVVFDPNNKSIMINYYNY